MKFKTYLLGLICFFHFSNLALAETMPLPDGVIAPDFTVTDINGNSHTLYDYLDAGIDVILDFGATWCGPCWNYHQTHILADIFNAGEAMVFMIEADASTPTSCIYGNCGNTIGNWTIGTPYPIVNLEGAELSVASDYAISYYPTLYGISAYTKKAYEIGQASRAVWQSWLLESFQLKETGAPVITDVACAGENNGSIDVTITGGYINRSYRWNNNSTSEDLSNLAPGDYYLTVTDAHNYSIELGPYTVGGPAIPLEPIPELIIPLTCANQPTGAIAVNGLGGTPGYNFNWSNGAAGPVISGLPAGMYTVTITDAAGCTEAEAFQVPSPPVLDLFVDSDDETCGEGNGRLLLAGGGGTPGYLYNIGWGSSPQEEYNNLSAGTYVITVTDANGCTDVETVEIENTPAPVADGGGDTEIACNETEVTLDGSDSSEGSNFTYLWTTEDGNIVEGDSTLMPVVDTAGTYVLLITNTQNDCVSTDTVEVSEIDDQTVADAGADQALDCANSSIRLDGSDSSEDTLSTYTYAWTGPEGHILEGDSTLTPLVDTVGEYILEVTNTLNGCVITDTVAVGEDYEIPEAEAGPEAAITCLINSLSLDGSASSADTSNTFAYQWTSPNGNIVSGDSTTTPLVNTPGYYFLLVNNTRNGCSAMDSVLVEDDTAEPGADAGTGEQLDCENTSTVLEGSSSSPNNVNYAWSTINGNIVSGANTTNPLVDQSGTYVLTVTDENNGCQSTSSVEITQDVEVPVADAGPSYQLDCINTDVSLSGSGSSASNNTSYAWSTTNGNIVSGANTTNPVVDQSGTYVLTVTDENNGCHSTASVEITQDVEAPVADAGPAFQLDCINTDVNLNGSGSSASNNTSYAWSTINGNIVSGANTTNPVVDQSGTYVLTVTDENNGCQSTASVEITQDVEVPVADAGPTFQLDCINTDVNLSGSGSSASNNTSYAWSTTDGNIVSGANTTNPLVDQSGTYVLTVTDENNGCQSTASVEITQDVEVPVADAGPANQLDCINTDVSLSGSGSSASNNTSYAWSTTNGNIVSGANTTNPVVDQSGTYVLTVTDENNGCQSSASVDITQDVEAPVADAGPTFQLDCTNTDVSLSGSGSSASNNTSYAWSTTNGNIVSGANTTNPVVDQSGTYVLTVTDENNGCHSTASVEITQDVEAPVADAGPSYQLDCINTDVNLSGSGSSASNNTSYAWSTTNGNIVSGANTTNPVVDRSGTYVLTVTDENNGCQSTASVEITQDVEAPVANAGPSYQLDCINTDVSLSGSGSSASNNTSYAWSTTNGNIVSGANTTNPVVDQSGTYVLTVTDENNGCHSTASVDITQDIELPVADAGPAGQLDCTNSQLFLDGSQSSTGNFAYLWISTNGNILYGEETLSPAIDQPGTYTLEVTNLNNGCINSSSVTVTEDTELPTVAIEQAPELNCAIREITLNGSGSSAGSQFSYLWLTNNGSIVSGGNSLNATVASAGSYTLTIQNNQNGCTASATVNVDEAPELEAALMIANENLCYGDASGAATVIASGGSGAYFYNWSNGSTTATANNLAAGVYIVSVTDEGGCETSLEVNISEPPLLIAQASSTDETANGAADGTATVTPTGGTPPFSFLWNNGATTQTINALLPGNYTVVVTDMHGCTSEAVVTVNQFNCSLSSSTSAGDLSCYGANDGMAGITINGGEGPYTYQWSNGAQTPTIDNLSAGTYTVTVTDANNCPLTRNITIEEPEAINISVVNKTDVLCYGDANGSIELNASGGSGTLSYQWSNGNTGNQAGDLPAGVYGIIVTDENNCTSDINLEISEPLQLEVSGNSTPLSAMGAGDGTASVSPSGGTPPYRYQWNTGANTSSITGLSPGTYTVEVTDDHGCSENETIVIQSFDCSSFSAIIQVSGLSCYDSDDGSALPVLNGGNGPFQYNWSNGSTLPELTGLTAGTYTLTVTDGSNCPAIINFTIERPLPIELEEVTLAHLNCFGDDTGSIQVLASGGTGNLSYNWPGGNTGPTVSNLSAGVYELEITDDNGCLFTQTFELEEPPLLQTTLTDQTNVQCADDQTGQASVLVEGGVPPYTYLWSSGATSANADQLSAGAHQLLVTDANGCETSFEVIIEADDQTAPTAVARDITISLDASGQAGVLPVQIDDGSSDNCGPVTLQLDQSQFDCAALGTNTVTLTVTDGAGNESTTTAVVTVIDDLAPQLVSCPSDIQSTDCSGLITYALPEATDNCDLSSPQLVSGLGNGATFPIGTTEEVYRFADASGNEVLCSFTVTVTNTLEAEVDSDAEVCYGQADAEATIIASGGNPAYEYSWSNGQTSATASGLAAGTYTYTVTDANGCTYEDQISITELPELILMVDEIIDEVGSNNMGSIDITVSGGTPPYQYFWSKGTVFISNEEDLTNIAAGSYRVEVIDAKGCVVLSQTLEVGNLTATIDRELDRQLQVFPNPTTGMISLTLQQPQTEEVRIEVFDAVGHQVLTSLTSGNQANMRLDLGRQPAGLYWIKISVGERMASRRIVVQR